MRWTDEMLILALENELHLIHAMTTSVSGDRLLLDGKPEAYVICMAFIRVADMIDRLSPEWKERHPAVCWDDMREAGNRYAQYPLSVDIEEMMAHVALDLPDFYEHVLNMLDECRDAIPY